MRYKIITSIYYKDDVCRKVRWSGKDLLKAFHVFQDYKDNLYFDKDFLQKLGVSASVCLWCSTEKQIISRYSI